jgi:uncharacterized membrane protein
MAEQGFDERRERAPGFPPPEGSAGSGPPGTIYGGSSAQAMAHFYRGEMNRLTVWRQRMDATTNWAIVATVGLMTFSFSNPLADAVFIVNVTTLWFLLTVESRRFRFYDVWRWRVRILEAHFITPILTGEMKRVPGPWREDLVADLLYPTFKMSMREAMGRRLLRNYAYLFAIVLVAALANVFGISLATSSWSLLTREHLTRSLQENWLLLSLLVLGYVPLLALGSFGWSRRKVAVELHDQPVRRPYRV